MLTGEPVPVEVAPGAEVAGATVNTYGRLVVRATKVGAETALAQIARLVAEAQSGKAPIQRLVDRVSGVFVPIVLALSLATLVGWLVVTGDRHRRVLGRRRRADHRLPVRARARDADRAHGRHRPRRAARHPHQGPRGARAHAAHHHGRPRQDGHGHRGPDGARRRRARSTARAAPRSCGSRAPSRRRREHPIAQAVAAAARARGRRAAAR